MSQSFLPLQTDRLELRLFRPTDLAAYSELALQPDCQRYVDNRPRNLQDCKAVLEVLSRRVALNRPGDVLPLAICDRDDGGVIGEADVIWQDATAAQAELRVLINPLYRRRGLGTEAARAVVDFGFAQFAFHRVFARCDARNAAAARLMRSLGMRLEAHYREHALFQGEWDEELHFAVLDREWRRSGKVRELTHLVA